MENVRPDRSGYAEAQARMKKISTTARVKKIAKQTGRSVTTIFRWRREGCDINNSASIKEYLEGNELRRNANLVRKGKGGGQTAPNGAAIPDLDQIELGPIGKLGAAAALMRLESIEERSHARLMRAIEVGNPFQVKACQEFYLRSSETLRRLDLAVETQRRAAEEQIPMWQVKDVSTQIASWLRTAFEEFLDAESGFLMDIDGLGEFKAHCIDRFKSRLYSTVKGSLKTKPIPDWAAANVIAAWNVPTL